MNLHVCTRSRELYFSPSYVIFPLRVIGKKRQIFHRSRRDASPQYMRNFVMVAVTSSWCNPWTIWITSYYNLQFSPFTNCQIRYWIFRQILRYQSAAVLSPEKYCHHPLCHGKKEYSVELTTWPFGDNTGGSSLKTANLFNSEPRMRSQSNNSVKNTRMTAISCLVES